jgi:hypothetical protein
VSWDTVFIVLGSLLSCAGIVNAGIDAAMWNNRIFVCEQGLRIVMRKGERIWRWEQIDGFSSNVVIMRYKTLGFITVGENIQHDYRLYAQGKMIEQFGSRYHPVEQLAQQLSEITFTRLLPLNLDALEQGQTLSFGNAITLNTTELCHGVYQFPVNAIRGAKVKAGSLYVLVENDTYRIPIQGARNAHILLALIEHLTHIQIAN